MADYGSGATVSLSLGAIGDYPGCVTYYEQRRFFGGTRVRPQMLWGTRPGTESDMSYTIPTQDDNRIKFRIAAQQASRVQHLVPISQLLALTETAEFRITSVNSDALTPNSISVKPQSYIARRPYSPSSSTTQRSMPLLAADTCESLATIGRLTASLQATSPFVPRTSLNSASVSWT